MREPGIGFAFSGQAARRDQTSFTVEPGVHCLVGTFLAVFNEKKITLLYCGSGAHGSGRLCGVSHFCKNNGSIL